MFDINAQPGGPLDFDINAILVPVPVVSPGANIATPTNLLAGYIVTTTRTFMSINGGPAFASEDAEIVLADEGYYEISVANEDEVATRYPVCILSSASSLRAGITPPNAGTGAAFTRMAKLLAPAYPHGRVTPRVLDHSTFAKVTTDRAAYLELRAPVRKLSTVLARGRGTWTSEMFTPPTGSVDIRLALVISPADTVLA